MRLKKNDVSVFKIEIMQKNLPNTTQTFINNKDKLILYSKLE